MFCSARKHLLEGTYQQSTNTCLTCYYDTYGKDLLKDYIIRNVHGAKCPDYHCSVSMGCGWIGSHHGGARMTCGKCSNSGNFHPGLSDKGSQMLNYISGHGACVTVQKQQKFVPEKKEDEREREEIERKYRIERVLAEQAYKKRQEEQEEQEVEAKKRKAVELRNNIRNVITEIGQSNDKIMKNIKNGFGYVFHFHNGVLNNVTYKNIPLKPVNSYCCCFKFRYSNSKILLKLFLKNVNKDCVYIYDSFKNFINIQTNANNINYNTFDDRTDYSATAVLVQKNGRYGLIFV